MTRKRPRKPLPLPPQSPEERQEENENPRMSDQEEELSQSQEVNPSTGQVEQPEQEVKLQEEEEEEVQEELQGMPTSPTPPASSPPHDVAVLDIQDAPPTGRRLGKRKKPPNRRERATTQKKLRLLKQHFKPVPLTPSKTLELSKHESLFKRLGLWDFAHLALDTQIRSDLLVLLFANYRAPTRGSNVGDFRIKVSRPDLARALRLPLKKDKANLSELQDSEKETLSEESLAIVEDFVSNYMLLHEEDTWMMPDEIMKWVKLIKEGQPQKVDFAALIWFMVEKELSQPLGEEDFFCYYASHLQWLIKSQRPELLKEETLPEEDDEDEENKDVTEVRSLEDLEVQDVGNRDTELSLGFDKNECEQPSRDYVNFEEPREDNHDRLVLTETENITAEPCLRQCISFKSAIRGEEERYEQHEKFSNLESLSPVKNEDDRYHQHEKFGLSSSDAIDEMAAASVSYGLPAEILDPSSVELMSSREDSLKNASLTLLNQHGPEIFGNSNKRIDDESDAPSFALSDRHGRIVDNGQWGQGQSGFDLCIEHAQAWLGKLKSMYEEKEQESARAHMQIQALTAHLQQREVYIQSLETVKMQEETKREMDLYRFQRELGIMTELLNGYKKALMETCRSFSEYRNKFKLHEDPVYKDFGESGGLVLTATEIEKLRLEKEQEEARLRLEKEEEERVKRCFLEAELKKFEEECVCAFNSHIKKIELFDSRLQKIEENVNHLQKCRSR